MRDRQHERILSELKQDMNSKDRCALLSHLGILPSIRVLPKAGYASHGRQCVNVDLPHLAARTTVAIPQLVQQTESMPSRVIVAACNHSSLRTCLEQPTTG